MVKKQRAAIIGEWHIAQLITWCGLLSAISGLYLVMTKQEIIGGIICLIISGLADFYDGKWARKWQRSETIKQHGIQLDTLVDVVSFLILPAIIGLTINSNLLTLTAIIIYIGAGIWRLSWFNVLTIYHGLPVTCVAWCLPIFYLFNNFTFNNSGVVWPIFFLVMAILFVLNFSFPKPRRKIIYALWTLVAIMLMIILWLLK